jgi:hypothetical protein
MAAMLAAGLVVVGAGVGLRALPGRGAEASYPQVSSYMPVTEEDFPTVLGRMRAAKAGIEARQQELLAARYDLGDRPAAGPR